MEITNLGKADGLPPVDWAAVAEKLDAAGPQAPWRSVGPAGRDCQILGGRLAAIRPCCAAQPGTAAEISQGRLQRGRLQLVSGLYGKEPLPPRRLAVADLGQCLSKPPA
jgi:hypothetical protein